MKFDSRVCSTLAASAALVAGMTLSAGAAFAAEGEVSIEPLKAKVAECGKLPDSQSEMCIAQAQANHSAQLPQPARTDAEAAALSQGETRYRDAYAACAKLPDSQKDTCRARAQADRSLALKEATRPPEMVAKLDQEMKDYQAALAECKKLPSSQQEICTANAGTSRKLGSQG